MLLKVMQVATRPTGALVSGKDAGDDTEPDAQSPAAPDAAGGGEADGADAGAADRLADEGTKTGAGEARRTRARLLVIEDEPGIVDFLRRGLDSEGFVVDAAGDGLGGVRRALFGGFEIGRIVLMLPGRNGMGVLGA